MISKRSNLNNLSIHLEICCCVSHRGRKFKGAKIIEIFGRCWDEIDMDREKKHCQEPPKMEATMEKVGILGARLILATGPQIPYHIRHGMGFRETSARSWK